MPPRVFITAVSRLSAPLDGSGLRPDARLGGRLSARLDLSLGPDEPRLHGMLRLAAEAALSQVPDFEKVPEHWKGLFVSSSKGGMELFQGVGPVHVGPYLDNFRSDGPAQALRRQLGWTGPGRNTPLACATGAYSLGLAFEEIRLGRIHAALAGAAEASLTPLVAAAFENIGALSDARSAAELRGPFDLRREGFVLGEGAALLLLEGEASLAMSGNRPLAELLGWASTCDAWHLTAPEPEGRQAARAMRLALEQACLEPGDIRYVSAHGTGTAAGDLAEAKALHRVFGGQPWLKLSSLKGATGHTLGAAGAIEAAATVEAMAGAPLPANVACVEAMPEVAPWLLREASPFEGNYALSLSMGFGGHNVAWVFGAL
jgi:3-oxoacyl-[acyl-carrier-protein] synthase II